jgi:hypothetical protein
VEAGDGKLAGLEVESQECRRDQRDQHLCTELSISYEHTRYKLDLDTLCVFVSRYCACRSRTVWHAIS